MRRASFHIGLVTLGTMGPLIVAFWWLGSAVTGMTVAEAQTLLAGPVGLWLNLMLWPALVGFIVVAVESRAIAIAILGGRYTERPLTIDQAIARSRRVFWRLMVAIVVVAIPISLGQRYVEQIIDDLSVVKGAAALPAALVVTVLIGSPLAYVLASVVLGDAGPIQAFGRSWRAFRARTLASVVVALFESVSVLLIAFGLSAGLDIAGRVLDSIGFGSDQGIVGSLVVSLALLAATFAFGTLLYTVTALALTPQVVVFAGLAGGAPCSTRSTRAVATIRRQHGPASGPSADSPARSSPGWASPGSAWSAW